MSMKKSRAVMIALPFLALLSAAAHKAISRFWGMEEPFFLILTFVFAVAFLGVLGYRSYEEMKRHVDRFS